MHGVDKEQVKMLHCAVDCVVSVRRKQTLLCLTDLSIGNRRRLLLRTGSGVLRDQFVCLSVCLSASISLEPLDGSSRNLLSISPVAVAGSSSGGVAIPGGGRSLIVYEWLVTQPHSVAKSVECFSGVCFFVCVPTGGCVCQSP